MWHRLATGITVFGLALGLAAHAQAAQVCHFLECAEGDTQAAPPAPIPERQTEAAKPVARPAQRGEICDEAGDLRYCVSSILPPQFGFNYRPKNLVDGKYDTAWVPDTAKSVDGIGETLIIDFAPNTSFRGLELWNGYHKNERIFLANNRVRMIEITLPNGKPQIFELEDGGKPQSFTLPQAVKVAWVKLRILSVYAGTKYRDTAITEVRVLP